MPLTLWKDVKDTPGICVRLQLEEAGHIHLELSFYRGDGALDRSFHGRIPADHTLGELTELWSFILDAHLAIQGANVITAVRRLGRGNGWPW